MATAEERMLVLKTVEEGKITPDEGARLLVALSQSAHRGHSSAARKDTRQLRVRVSDVATGRAKASVHLPLGQVRVGLQIGAHIVPEIAGFEMEQLASAIQTGMTGKVADIVDEQDGERVEVWAK